jgi:electron transfer flavoprotein alpha/beta subunit
MKIAVCVKQVVDITTPLGLAHSRPELVEDNLYYMENPADECALEEALLISPVFFTSIKGLRSFPHNPQDLLLLLLSLLYK